MATSEYSSKQDPKLDILVPGPHHDLLAGSFINASGLKINTRYWQPKSEIRALVGILHGYAAHCMRYDKVATSLAEDGIFCFGHDYQGMGESEGERVPALDYTVYTADIIQHIALIRSKYPSFPLFLVGQSIGCLLILMCLLERGDLCQGVILLGACIKPAVGWAPRLLLSCANYLAPGYSLIGSDSRSLSRDQEEVRKYQEDPLAWNSGLSIGFIHSFFSHIDMVRPRLGEITTPTLLYHGGSDTTVSPDNAHVIHEAISSSDKEVRVIPLCLHSLLHELEPERSNVVNGIRKWVLDRAVTK
ncbi:Monoglyceride lipase isoform X2 [Oopsacas minuta]|uniref:Monoglyceride lipase isoform X2 n=1 Tax=Oopsacas minuta TaxID=111878 RepID=A0AAV7JUX5_9METZ|nr:Monoglyceride lipase isoform X2 [Oopsacas minuta]